jgi:hypothetical protein
VQELLQAAAAVGKHITDPVQRYKFTEIIARHLDRAMGEAVETKNRLLEAAINQLSPEMKAVLETERKAPDLPDFPPSAGDELPYTNGHYEHVEYGVTTDGAIGFASVDLETVDAIASAVATDDAARAASKPVKRGRGRPKGSVGKKKRASRAKPKAAAEAKPVEAAPPATEPSS